MFITFPGTQLLASTLMLLWNRVLNLISANQRYPGHLKFVRNPGLPDRREFIE